MIDCYNGGVLREVVVFGEWSCRDCADMCERAIILEIITALATEFYYASLGRALQRHTVSVVVVFVCLCVILQCNFLHDQNGLSNAWKLQWTRNSMDSKWTRNSVAYNSKF